MFKTWTGADQAMAPMASSNSPGPGGVSGVGGWHPTILYLIGLLILEVFLVGILTRTVLR
jgi:uncharacterized membrane protein YtjA (UPF0391 family)